MGCRFWHTTVVSQSSTRIRQLLTFGGCPGAPESHTTGSWPKMANTVLTEMGTYFILGEPCHYGLWLNTFVGRGLYIQSDTQYVKVFFAISQEISPSKPIFEPTTLFFCF